MVSKGIGLEGFLHLLFCCQWKWRQFCDIPHLNNKLLKCYVVFFQWSLIERKIQNARMLLVLTTTGSKPKPTAATPDKNCLQILPRILIFCKNYAETEAQNSPLLDETINSVLSPCLGNGVSSDTCRYQLRPFHCQ